MSGWNEDGQLALMDAMIFFVASIAVTGILFSLVYDSSPSVGDDDQRGFDAENTLQVFLDSCLGTEVEVCVHGGSLMLSPREFIYDCLLLEAHCIAEGDDPSGFSALNSELIDLLRIISGPFMEPSFRLVDGSNGTPMVMISVPSEWRDARIAFAASQGFSDAEGGTFMVQFRSLPSPGAEPVGIRGRDLDLRLRELLAP